MEQYTAKGSFKSNLPPHPHPHIPWSGRRATEDILVLQDVGTFTGTLD